MFCNDYLPANPGGKEEETKLIKVEYTVFFPHFPAIIGPDFPEPETRILKSEAISRIFESVKYRDVSNGKQKQWHLLDE